MMQPCKMESNISNLLNIDIQRDDKYDILYILVGPRASAISEPLIDGIYVRREVGTERIAGVIIERYSQRDKGCLIDLLPSLPIKRSDLP